MIVFPTYKILDSVTKYRKGEAGKLFLLHEMFVWLTACKDAPSINNTDTYNDLHVTGL